MNLGKNFTISAEVANGTWTFSKPFFGTESEAYVEAMDVMNDLVLKYIKDNNITNSAEQEKIIDGATHTIVYEDKDDPILCYAVVANDLDEILGVYYDRADAEEAIFTECENYAIEVLMNDDPVELFGRVAFDYAKDYWYLMHDVANEYNITVTRVYGLQEIVE